MEKYVSLKYVSPLLSCPVLGSRKSCRDKKLKPHSSLRHFPVAGGLDSRLKKTNSLVLSHPLKDEIRHQMLLPENGENFWDDLYHFPWSLFLNGCLTYISKGYLFHKGKLKILCKKVKEVWYTPIISEVAGKEVFKAFWGLYSFQVPLPLEMHSLSINRM